MQNANISNIWFEAIHHRIQHLLFISWNASSQLLLPLLKQKGQDQDSPLATSWFSLFKLSYRFQNLVMQQSYIEWIQCINTIIHLLIILKRCESLTFLRKSLQSARSPTSRLKCSIIYNRISHVKTRSTLSSWRKIPPPPKKHNN